VTTVELRGDSRPSKRRRAVDRANRAATWRCTRVETAKPTAAVVKGHGSVVETPEHDLVTWEGKVVRGERKIAIEALHDCC
jgi:hypothetical protein